MQQAEKKAAKRYGVLRMAGLYAARVTFYIDKAGKIVRIDDDVDTETHGPDVIRSLEELGFPKRP